MRHLSLYYWASPRSFFTWYPEWFLNYLLDYIDFQEFSVAFYYILNLVVLPISIRLWPTFFTCEADGTNDSPNWIHNIFTHALTSRMTCNSPLPSVTCLFLLHSHRLLIFHHFVICSHCSSTRLVDHWGQRLCFLPVLSGLRFLFIVQWMFTKFT